MQNNEQVQRSTPWNRKARDFFYHLVVFLFVLTIFFLVSGVSGALVWLLVIWGFTVALHGIYAYFG